jgi:hypothetical protein
VTPAERQVLERSQIQMTQLMQAAARAYGAIEALLDAEDDRPKPGPLR